jgi:hypothetical protein
MKFSSYLPALAAVAGLSLPMTASAKDKGGHSHGHGHSSHYPHHSYSHYHSGYWGYSHWPYYRFGPTLGFSFYSRPYTVYRGYTATQYADGLAADVQRELRRRGYYRGAIDGDIGPGSRAAIRAFQSDYGLRITGRIDSTLLRVLRIS